MVNGQHLFDHVRPWLARPAGERIAFIRAARWIAYERALAAHRSFDDLLARPPSLRTVGLMLLGPAANGKSMIVERFALEHLKQAEANNEQPRVWVVQTREGTGLLNFYGGILSALQAPQTRSRDTLAKAEQLDCLFRQMRPRLLIFDEFHNCLRGRSRDVEAIFAVLRRLGRDYDISPVLVGDVSVYDHVALTQEMASRFELAAVPRWTYGEEFFALLDSLEAAFPLDVASNLSNEPTARAIFTLSDGLIGEIVAIVTQAAILALRDGVEQITAATIADLRYVPLSRRRGAPQRDALL